MEERRLLKHFPAWLFIIILAAAMVGITAQAAFAETVEDKAGDFGVNLYLEEGGASVVVTAYNGSAATVTCPNVIVYNGKEYIGESDTSAFVLGSPGTPFKDNSTVKKVIVPNGYSAIGSETFYGASALEEVVIGNISDYIGSNAFANCPNLKIYRFAEGVADPGSADPGIGKDASGKIMAGVKAYVVEGSKIDEYLKAQNAASKAAGGNEIELIYSENPAAEANVTAKETVGAGGSGPAPDPTKQYGKDGTPCGEGARIEAANKAITALSGEKDAKGAVYSKLRLKMKKLAKTSITLSWSKPSGTAKFVLYGNKCGKKKYVKIKELKGTSLKVTKVAGSKVKKGTYYKFLVVAVDKNKKVVSTSKTIHLATKGGKVTNHKSVIVKVKKKKVSKVTVKKGKKVTFKATGVKASKKLKFKQHIGMRFESTNKKVATVTSKGVVKGVKKGKCKVYAYSQSGVAKAVTVTVK